MTQTEKDLLLKDFCARLPYGVIAKVTYSFNNETTFGEDVITSENHEIECVNRKNYTIVADGDIHDIEEVKPYLRPMSSMTEKEKSEFETLGWRVDELENNEAWAHNTSINSIIIGINWLNSHYFDYRGLIPMGLALEAKGGMYKI